MSVIVKGLNKSYGRHQAIRNLSFNIQEGEIVGILGPNGAGKSTTIRIITGLMPASSGEAYVCGIPVNYYPQKVKQHIGYMPENNPLPLDLYVIEYLKYRAELKNLPHSKIKTEVERVMQACELYEKVAKQPIRTLSKGYRQRVGIAEALLGNPDILILDEPTIGLDPHQILSVRRLIRSLSGQLTVLLCSHILSEVQACCDRVLILNQGYKVAEGSYESLRKNFFPQPVYQLSVLGNLYSIKSQIESVGFCLSEDAAAESSASSAKTEPLISSSSSATPSRTHSVALKGNPEWSPYDRQKASSALIRLFEHTDSCDLTGFYETQPSLEEIFLEATKRAWK